MSTRGYLGIGWFVGVSEKAWVVEAPGSLEVVEFGLPAFASLVGGAGNGRFCNDAVGAMPLMQ
jgi:hypothetical protein